MLKNILANNPGIEVTPQILLQFVAERTKHSPRDSPDASLVEEDLTLTGDRGRHSSFGNGRHSRSSSQSSGGTSRVPSRPPSVPPKTPATPGSAFDTSRRQRTTPLDAQPPSSWSKRPAPASRRKSVDGGFSRTLSDSEVRNVFHYELTLLKLTFVSRLSHPVPPHSVAPLGECVLHQIQQVLQAPLQASYLRPQLARRLSCDHLHVPNRSPSPVSGSTTHLRTGITTLQESIHQTTTLHLNIHREGTTFRIKSLLYPCQAQHPTRILKVKMSQR